MNIHIKPYSNLTVAELYAVFRLRSEVFMFEQQCFYQDLDNQDQHAEHILLMHPDTDALAAYARTFAPNPQDPHARIGRVIVAAEFRGQQIARQLMKVAIQHLRQQFGDNLIIDISAQSYLCQFYQSLGFEIRSPEYMEVGIPHCDMRLT